MPIHDTITRAASKLRRVARRETYTSPLGRFVSREAPSDIGQSELAQIFQQHDGRAVNKWKHYLDTYERYLTVYRNTPVRMLEIGVFRGGSLELWRKYLGEQATIFGIDINPDCVSYADPPNQIRVGSQDDPVFLASVLAEMGGVDLVLDDGSHVGRHQVASFEYLWPRLLEGGLYIIEDIHTSYFSVGFEGGFGRRGTAIEFTKSLVDDLHFWYHERGGRADIGSIHFHDSMVFIEKRPSHQPVPVVAPVTGMSVSL